MGADGPDRDRTGRRAHYRMMPTLLNSGSPPQ